MKNNKGFSMIELLAVIAIMSILLGTGIAAYLRYIDYSRKKAYDQMVNSAENAMESYILKHPNTKKVYFDDLYKAGLLSNIMDPKNQGKDCSGKVLLTNKNEGDEEVLSDNEYKISICCDDYEYTYTYDKTKKKYVATKDSYCKVNPYDLSSITDIKVLNIYPPGFSNNVTEWMTSYGKGIIKVDKVDIDTFNANPDTYLRENGKWKYDELVFGFADCNGSRDLSENAATMVRKYLNSGGSAIFGHDTMLIEGCNRNGVHGHPNFASLASYVGFELDTSSASQSSTKVKIVKEGIFTTYPYKIGKLNDILTIPNSHVSRQIAHGNVWLTFDGTTETDPSRIIYLSTYGNNAFIQTGHSNGAATQDEQKIIANIIFYNYAKQLVDEDEEENIIEPVTDPNIENKPRINCKENTVKSKNISINTADYQDKTCQKNAQGHYGSCYTPKDKYGNYDYPCKRYQMYDRTCTCTYSKNTNKYCSSTYKDDSKGHVMTVKYEDNTNGINACNSTSPTSFNSYVHSVCTYGVFAEGENLLSYFHGYTFSKGQSNLYQNIDISKVWVHSNISGVSDNDVVPRDTDIDGVPDFEQGCRDTCIKFANQISALAS